MDDEKYAFEEDVREKKKIARSARNKHRNGGRVRLHSDNLSNKELKAMSGEVKSYKLNEPLKWAEFKYMPDDLKISYVKQIRERFNVSDSRIAHMLGISQNSFSGHIRRLGLGLGRGTGNQKSDMDGFLTWCAGTSLVTADPMEEITECEPVPATVPEIKTIPVRQDPVRVIPHSGTLNLEGRLEDVLNTVTVLLGGTKVRLCVSWEVQQDEGVCCCAE
jgi:hypothetical protein